jgi:iron complex outermembrane receptor protein
MIRESRAKKFITVLMASAGSVIFMCSPAYAQSPPAADASAGSADQLGDIVVTAQRRSENLQKVPVTVNVVSASAVANYGIQTSQQLQTAVPGLIINKSQMNAAPFLRGVGANSGAAGLEMPVAIYMDGVYLPIAAANIFNLSSIDRIEVLKGPQGTLFGRNATGGVISIVTRDPSVQTRADFDVSYGNYDSWAANGYVGGALSDTVAADLVYSGSRQGDGFGKNTSTGDDAARDYYSDAVRGKLKWKLGDATDLTLIGSYSRQKSSMNAFTPVKGASDFITAIPAPSGFYDAYGTPQYAKSHGYALSGKLEHDFGWATLTDIVAYQDTRIKQHLDFDAAVQALPDNTYRGSEKIFTNEVQLASPSNQTVTWVAGLFYMDLKNNNISGTANYVSSPQTEFITNKTQSIAPFGQVTVKVTDSTRVTGGLRYTHDNLHINGNGFDATGIILYPLPAIGSTPAKDPNQRSKQGRVTWRAAIEQDFSPDVMAYISYNRGFRAGIFNTANPLLPVTDPEILDAYEGGLKTTLFDRKVNLNVSIFHYEYKDILLRSFDPVLVKTFLTNAAHARETGADIDLRAKIDEFDITAGVEYIDAKYDDFPNAVISTRKANGQNSQVIASASGNRMVQVPKLSFQAGISRSVSLGESKLTGSVNLKHTSTTVFDPDNRFKQGPVDLVSGTLKWSIPGKPWEIAVYGTNLLDEKYHQGYSSSGSDYIVVAAPRQYGVRLGAHF